MGISGAGILCVIPFLCLFLPSLAKDYVVGDTTGWAIGVDYTTWTSDKTFAVGDNLVFNYGSGHTADEVSESDYKSCTVGNAITSDNSGTTKVALKTVGAHYFICGVIGHCGSGMKLAVTVGGSATTTPSSPGTTSPAAPTAGTNASTTTPSSTIPESSSGTVRSAFVPVLMSWFIGLMLVLY